MTNDMMNLRDLVEKKLTDWKGVKEARLERNGEISVIRKDP
jgi:uncharacterized membrane protein YcaP (DUF421 family)